VSRGTKLYQTHLSPFTTRIRQTCGAWGTIAELLGERESIPAPVIELKPEEARVSRARSPRRHVVLYSGGQERRNALIHESLLALALRRPGKRAKKQIRMTYVAFTAEGAVGFFRRFERRYKAFGGTHFHCISADDALLARPGKARDRAAKILLSSDVVYLSGGNTFHYLMHLRRSGLFPILRRFADRGGVLAGLSAGALLATPNIGLAAYPAFDRDENEVGLAESRWGGLDLVGFEFFPHYRKSRRYREALLLYSRRSQFPLYACSDGSGIVVEGDRFTAHGDVWLFDRGQERKIQG
jgi:dipeptidase E